MTIWKPTLSNREQPLYLAIANSIAEDIANGRLSDGERLPPQRDLADELKIALTTVTRAYTEAERRGLVSGEVGRGTFVRRMETFGLRRVAPEPSALDLTVNNLPPFAFARELMESVGRILVSGGPSPLLEYQPHQGHPRHRAAGTKFLKTLGLFALPDHLLVTAGAQHAMAVVFSTITTPGDTVLTAEVTYSGMKSLANFLHLRLRGLAMDEEGIRPDALEAACATTDAKALYCMPTLQNPTSAVMSENRRRDIVAIAERSGLAVVEDDSYGFLLPRQKSLRTFAQNPARFYYLTGTSKSLAPGLRVGLLVSPPQMVDRLAASLSATTIMAPSPMAELVSHWIDDGTAERVMEWKRGEIRARQKLASSVLSRFDYRAHPASPHGWLTIPEPWCVRDFVAQARMRGIVLSPAEDFIAARATSAHAVRICLGPVEQRSRLEFALTTVAEILERAPAPYQALV
ncbi:MAG: PLP-dependent aminotransferase family protein [Vicinamibacteria bacterium]